MLQSVNAQVYSRQLTVAATSHTHGYSRQFTMAATSHTHGYSRRFTMAPIRIPTATHASSLWRDFAYPRLLTPVHYGGDFAYPQLLTPVHSYILYTFYMP